MTTEPPRSDWPPERKQPEAPWPPTPDAPAETSAPPPTSWDTDADPAPAGVGFAAVAPPVSGGPAKAKGKGKGKGGMVAVIAAVALGGGGLFLKYGLGFLAATVVSGALGSVFGGPFEKLPSDQKQAFERRYDAAVGDTLKGLSDTDASTKVEKLIVDGMPRLPDAPLVERLQLFSLILQGADEPTCATLARSLTVGGTDEKAFAKALETLDLAKYARWVDINLTAMEAQAAGTPAPRAPTEEAVNLMFDHLSPHLTEAQVNGIVALTDGTEVADSEACSSFRALYAGLLALDPVDLNTAALYEVTP